jgi:glyoxylase-like metal-dependent hydrolase (beta-lactamase superfamily II)
MSMSTDGLDEVDFVGGAPVDGGLDVVWNHGTRGRKGGKEPAIQVHHYDEHTVILRQSKTLNYEAPFLFLLFGNRRAFLLDTGATEDAQVFPLRATVDRLIDEWLSRHPREEYGLVVAHTHGHGDHVAGDGQFEGRAHTEVVGREVEEVQAFFGFDPASWPVQTVEFDLGGRVLELFGSPGHHKAAVTTYDPWTAILFTGDTILPGRLYAFDFPEFRATVDRMVAFAETHPVRHVFGCHVEMTDQPGRDYPIGAEYQPHERAPQMTVAQLLAVRDASGAVAARPGVHVFDDFIVYHEPTEKDMKKLVRRGKRALLIAKATQKIGL